MAQVPPAKAWHGRKLREFRERCKMSASEVGRRARISATEVSDYEQTKKLPGLRVLRALIKALDLDLFDLDELLRLDQVKPMSVRKFRAACRIEGNSPREILQGLIDVYPDKVKENIRDRRCADGDTGEDSR